MRLILVLFGTLLAVGCGYGSGYKANSPQTMPGGSSISIAQLAPSSVMAGSAGFLMTVNGSGFGTDALVYFNTVPHNTTVISGSQLMTMISSADVATAGMKPVYVRTGGRNSNQVNFTVQ
jgi:IPT/TIG domain-containing protein